MTSKLVDAINALLFVAIYIAVPIAVAYACLSAALDTMARVGVLPS